MYAHRREFSDHAQYAFGNDILAAATVAEEEAGVAEEDAAEGCLEGATCGPVAGVVAPKSCCLAELHFLVLSGHYAGLPKLRSRGPVSHRLFRIPT